MAEGYDPLVAKLQTLGDNQIKRPSSLAMDFTQTTHSPTAFRYHISLNISQLILA